MQRTSYRTRTSDMSLGIAGRLGARDLDLPPKRLQTRNQLRQFASFVSLSSSFPASSPFRAASCISFYMTRILKNVI